MEWFNWVEQVLRNYAQFNGRSRRKEYWYFMPTFLMTFPLRGLLRSWVAVM